MTPIPWPLIRRGRPVPAPAPTPAEIARTTLDGLHAAAHPPAAPRPDPGTGADENAAMRDQRGWVRWEDAVLGRLAQLTDQYGPWHAARRMFADEETENR